MRWGWNFNFNYHFILVQVIWAIGLSMLLLAALVAIDVPSRWIGVFGAILIVGHNLLDLSRFSVNPGDLGRLSWLWNVLVRPGAIQPATNVTLLVAYPVLPWFGIMAVGFALGEVMIQAPTTTDPNHRCPGIGNVSLVRGPASGQYLRRPDPLESPGHRGEDGPVVHQLPEVSSVATLRPDDDRAWSAGPGRLRRLRGPDVRGQPVPSGECS